MRWLPLVHVQLPFTQALTFYVMAWLGAWLTTQALLPLAWPRWAEDGGELRYAPVRDDSIPRAVLAMLVIALLIVGIFFSVAL